MTWTDQTKQDLMEKRAEIYSDRPYMAVMGELRGSVGVDQVVLGYNNRAFPPTDEFSVV